MARPRTYHYVISRLASGATVLGLDPPPTTSLPVSVSGMTGTLYLYVGVPHTPSWLADLALLVGNTPKVEVASAGAILHFRRKGREYALTYGTGHAYLPPGMVQPLFGLRATLNAADLEHGIRTIDTDELDTIPRHAREQATRHTPLLEFRFDPERNLLRAVAGIPKDAHLGSSIGGRDSLRLTTNRPPSELPTILDEAEELASRDDYKATCSWLDHLQRVTDPLHHERLDRNLLDLLPQPDQDSIWLAAPEIIPVDGPTYSYTPKGEQYDDLRLTDYLAERSPSTIERLRQDRAYLHDARTDTPAKTWRVYDCLYAELARSDTTYLLSGGAWYRLSPDYVAEVNTAVAAIKLLKAYLPKASSLHEPSYNKSVPTTHPQFVLLDARTITHGGGRSKIEAADLYDTSTNTFVHNKKYAASSVLSYVFTQGLIASTLFSRDTAYRTKLKTVHPNAFGTLTPGTPPARRQYRVVFGILTNRPRTPTSLPFFSRVTLRHVAEELRHLGYRVALHFIGT